MPQPGVAIKQTAVIKKELCAGFPGHLPAFHCHGLDLRQGARGFRHREDAWIPVLSPAFLQGDGGWNRIVWVPKDIKEEIADAIPEEVYPAIATEEDALDIKALENFLREKKHPITVKYWKEGKPVPIRVPLPGHDWADELPPEDRRKKGVAAL